MTMVEPYIEPKILQALKERRLERMRLGQATGELVGLASDQEVRVALVPLLEKEYDQCMRAVANMIVPDNVAGAGLMDRQEKREILVRAIRDPSDYSKRMFRDVDDMMDYLEPVDINHVYDAYVEMAMAISPHVADLSDEEIDFLKQLFVDFQWKGLSGKQAYALRRFISTLSLTQPLDNLPGFSSTTS